MKNRYKVMTGVISLVVILVVIIFLANLAKARNVYEENIVFENINFFDAAAEDSTLYYAYVKENNIILETRTFGDKILGTKSVSSVNPTDISLLIFNGLPYVIWKASSQIVVWDGEKQIIISEEGINPKLFGFGDEVYAVWMENGLYTKPIYSEAKWQITDSVSYYSIYDYDDQKIYLTYTKNGIICFRTFLGSWTQEECVYDGFIPHTITNGEITYIYHKSDSGILSCFYGANDDIKLVEQITETTVFEIITQEDVLAFTTTDGLFVQRITQEGFSQTYQVTSNPATKINCFYADSDDIMFTYNIEKRIICKFINVPEITEESSKPIVLDIGSTEELIKKNAFDYISDYNSRKYQAKGSVKSWIVRHSGESLVFLGVIIITIIVVVTYLMGRRKDRQRGK